jgi:membrane associated rhomboid family serine protease
MDFHPRAPTQLGWLVDVPTSLEVVIDLLQGNQIGPDRIDHCCRALQLDPAISTPAVSDIESSHPEALAIHRVSLGKSLWDHLHVSTETPSTDTVAEDEQLYCYGHPKTPTRLRCSRCERPICGRCAIPASVGQHCPECVAEARRTAPKIRSALGATAPAVTTIIVINVIAFVLQRLVPSLTSDYASFAPAIADGEYWRLMTSMFLHSPSFIFHILMNMYVLYIYGPNVEQAFGTPRFVLMYLICGFTGSAMSYNLSSCVGGVGASGAIFGVAGVLLMYLYKRRASTLMHHAYRSILAFVGLNLAIGFMIPVIDNWAHIGGLLGGVALGAGLDDSRGTPSPLRQVLVIGAVIGIGLLAVVYRTATFSCPVPGLGG